MLLSIDDLNLSALEKSTGPIENGMRTLVTYRYPFRDVTRVQPAVAIERFSGLLLVAVVAFEDVGTFDAQFADVVLSVVLHVGYVGELDHVAVQGHADVARAWIAQRLARRDTAAFGLSVAFDDVGTADTLEK